MPRGRPKIQLDYELIEKLAGIMCTQEEIAHFCNCSVDTLLRDPNFATIYKRGKETGKMSLRRMQWKHAEKSFQMAIFLGKQYLGQKDIVEEQHSMNNGVLNDLIGALNNVKKN